jgi:hypothetical protein
MFIDFSVLLPQFDAGQFLPLLLWPFFGPALFFASIATAIGWLILP